MSAPRFVFRRISKIPSVICLLPLLAALNAAPIEDDGRQSSHRDENAQRSEATKAVRVAPGSHRITIPFYDEKRATVVVKVTIDNDSKQMTEVFLKFVVKDAEGNEVAHAESGIVVAVGEQGSTEQWVNLKRPQIWSPENAYLYTVQTIVSLGDDVIDTVESSFGVGATADADK